MPTPAHVLVLGGTTEARALAARLAARADLRLTYSLAGRTAAPALPGGTLRTGGFGGADGLAGWMSAQRVTLLVDATHPFAARISANAAAAAAATRVPLVTIRRPGWTREPGDRWTLVPDMAAAAAALGPRPARVLLAIGRQEVAAFRAAPHHRYLVRSIEPVAPGDLPPGAGTILARGPFDEPAERALLRDHAIDTVVAKDSGGAAAYAKIAAARALSLTVVMVARPPGPPALPTVEAALETIEAHLATPRGE